MISSMNTLMAPAQDPPADSSTPAEGLLTIGEVAREGGVTVERLRMWESRYGFPVAQRLPSGHRRYPVDVITDVRAVIALQAAGVRLEQAIDRAVRSESTAPFSVFAQLRRGFGHLAAHRLSKRTLIAISWAIEDECCAQAQRPMLFGAFQYARNYHSAAARWAELARVADQTLVMADFSAAARAEGAASGQAAAEEPRTDAEVKAVSRVRRPVLVDLPDDSPMLREWTVVCDAPDFPAALAAWEIPGQDDVPDLDRIYEAVWTIEPRAVREAARAFAEVARAAGCAEAAPILYKLASTPEPGIGDLAGVTTLFNRVVAYVDAGVRRG
jgi:MerR family transcriptional regulator, light-induced transcriptional regulator